jgi:uncharacterized membrane protein
MILSKILSRRELKELKEEIAKLNEKFGINGEIIIEKESDPYPGAVLRIAIFLSVILSLITLYVLEFEYSFFVLLLPLIFILITLPLVRIFNLKSYALSSGEMKREVSEKALETFYAHNMNHTEAKIYFLFYYSILEKRFEFIFNDSEDLSIKDSLKEKIVEGFLEHFKKNEYFLAFMSAINNIQNDFQGHSPAGELSNNLLENDDNHLISQEE